LPHYRLGGSSYGYGAVLLADQVARDFALPDPQIFIDPSIKPPYRGLYNADSKIITISDPVDRENVFHEALHYVSDLRYGNPLALFVCDDPSCVYHHPIVAQRLRGFY
jgi:hypothetical protein